MISIIVAIGKNNVIGKNNKLLWNLPDDLRRFKELTTNNVVVMGKNTYYSLPSSKALKNRINIVFSKSENIKDVEVVTSIDEAFSKFDKYQDKEIFIIGGESIYNMFIDIVDKIYLTIVGSDLDGDTFFPQIDYSKWNIELDQINDNNEYVFQNIILTKKV
jgi:dihydrofolate reductase